MGKFKQLRAQLLGTQTKKHDALEVDVSPEAPKSSAQKLTRAVQSSPSIILPFQAYVYTFHGTENESWSCDISHLIEVKDLASIYRFAELTDLRAVFRGTHEAIEEPFTVECLWTTQDVVARDKDFAKSVGSQQFIVGGMLSNNEHPYLEANLRNLNPAVKASVTYKDTPRFCMRVRPNKEAYAAALQEGAKKTTHGLLIICGQLRVSSPGFAHCNFVEE